MQPDLLRVQLPHDFTERTQQFKPTRSGWGTIAAKQAASAFRIRINYRGVDDVIMRIGFDVDVMSSTMYARSNFTANSVTLIILSRICCSISKPIISNGLSVSHVPADVTTTNSMLATAMSARPRHEKLFQKQGQQ